MTLIEILALLLIILVIGSFVASFAEPFLRGASMPARIAFGAFVVATTWPVVVALRAGEITGAAVSEALDE